MTDRKMPADLSKRRGCFTIDRMMIEREPDLVMKVLCDVLVIRAEYHWTHRVEYMGLSPHFEPVDDATTAHHYRVRLHHAGDELRVEWVRLEKPDALRG
jgi:hypothetical protein